MSSFKEKINDLKNKTKEYVKIESQFGNKDFLSSGEDRQVQLDELSGEIGKCAKCELHLRRKNVVPGEGNPNAELIFIGEAPGRDEDEQARPFVGRAGKLLTKIIQAMGMERSDVFIANIIKCRPPNNRNPYPYEIESCEPYLLKQLDIIKPKIICTLGKFATQSLLKEEISISKVRGKFCDYHGIKLMPTYHPAYLLRNPSEKRPVWEDMKKIMKHLKV